MPTLHRLESPNDPFTAGVLVSWDDGTHKEISWSSRKPVNVERAARTVVETLLEDALRDGQAGEARIRDTNWVSLVAAVCKHIADWNDGIRAQSGANANPEPPAVH